MWIYECEAGVYKEDTLVKLVWCIFRHRMHHLIEHGKFAD
jgi:hypothetical protein